MSTYKLKCQNYSVCGNSEERSKPWDKITCFSCKQNKNRELAKKQYQEKKK